jgi:SAM-dependent methyltransferase
MKKDIIERETQVTLRNRSRLFTNRNLLYWYKRLYEQQFGCFSDITKKSILEIGSGTSPLKIYYKNVKASDILKLEYLDYVFDAQEIDKFSEVQDNSLDIITMTNVLHHLKNPCDFLLKASNKLKKGGSVIFTEPYFSFLSKYIYIYLHHEPTDLKIEKPELLEVEGPLRYANIALPYLIMKGRWVDLLRETYLFSQKDCSCFSTISYFATGGISRCIPIPHTLYKSMFGFDLWLARTFPQVFSSFFIMKLLKR